MTQDSTTTCEDYVDLEVQTPKYECSGCGWVHNEEQAFGVRWERDTCPQCNILITYSKEVRIPDHSPDEFTGFSNRTVRL